MGCMGQLAELAWLMQAVRTFNKCINKDLVLNSMKTSYFKEE